MNDLSGLDWSAGGGGSSSSGQQQQKPNYSMASPSFPSLQPSPSPFGSNRSSPAPSTSTSTPPPQSQQPAKPAQDSFSNLARFGPAKSNQNLTLAQRQAQLEEEKRRKAEEQRKLTEAQFGSGQFWDSLGSRGATASPAAAAAAKPSPVASSNDDDLFAAFNKDTQVDNASHFPPPASQRSTPVGNPAPASKPLDLSDPTAWGGSASAKPASPAAALPEDDDDPFGLKTMKPAAAAASPAPPPAADDDFDFMGDLNKPVDEVRRHQAASQPQAAPGRPIEDDDSSSDDDLPVQPQRQAAPSRPRQAQPSANDAGFDQAVAQLVDYGFSPEDARRGLLESGAGTNVQAAANWLLDDAHRKSKAKAEGRDPSTVSAPPRRQAGSPASGGDADFSHTAAAVGSTLFKTANSLWKTGQKRMQKAVAEFQQPEAGDPSQPRWLREAQMHQESGGSARASSNATDEAMMLESGGRPRPSRTSSRQRPEEPTQRSSSSSQPRPQTTSQPSSSRNSPVPRWQQQSAPPPLDAKAKISRMKAEDDSFSTYSSPNRRRRQQPAAAAAPTKPAEPEPDLLFNSQAPSAAQSLPTRPAPQQQQRPQRASPPVQPRPTRQVPPISPEALDRSTRHRLEGTAHFKRGDYAAAHASYSASLSAVPPTHPLAILLLTNRALTALKTGEPKQAVESADQAVSLIGPGNGQGETVAVRGEAGAAEEQRDMRDLLGKALSRKAEALEQMEKWADAGLVWQQCVEAGLGGANAIKGRQRCQNAVKPKPKPAAAAPQQQRRPAPRPMATATPAKSSEAVSRLREANEAAAKEETERVAITDAVDARVSAWRDGKRDNLRALLGSLDAVLWEGSGWKKISMADLVMANKVKINYMKAIAKTHPDKLPQDANTEVRMIAGLVFSTLNESWDKFKAENGL